MSTPIPTPPAGQSRNLFVGLALVVFFLVLGDYYMLTHTQQIRQARQREDTVSREINRQKSLDGSPGARSLRKGSRFIGELWQTLQDRFVLKAAGFYGRVGAFVRGSALAAFLLLLYGQNAPPRKPGQPRRKPLPEKTRKMIFLLSGMVFGLSAYVLMGISQYPVPFVTYAYPLAFLLAFCATFAAGQVIARNRVPAFGLTTERKRIQSPNGFSLPTQDGGFINVPNAYRGSLVLGGAGAGKSFSIGEPIIEQFAEKNLAGIIYDFKFPVLTEVAQRAMALAGRGRKQPEERGPEVRLHVVNFRDLARTERINPLRAEDMPAMAYAEEYSRAIIHNLNTHIIRNPGEFFSSSAIAFLTGIIWFYRKYYPACCTIPHVVATALYKDYRHVLSMLDTDAECGDLVRSLITAVESKAEKQIAGVVATLQIILTRINSPEMVWVLTPDEERGEGFSLHLNDPNQPKLLCIGNDPTLKDSFSPVISCILTVALKLMNQQGKHPSYVLLDEAATLYVPGLEVIPATARSNRIATVYMSQDLSQMVDTYGREKTQVMVSNLNNWFIGKVNNMETAELISKVVGREDKEMVSTSLGSSSAGYGKRNRSHSQSASFQERNLVRLQDAISLGQGEFIGQTVETDSPFFQGYVSRKDAPQQRMVLEPFAHFTDRDQITSGEDVQSTIVQANFQKVRDDVRDTIELYPNTLASGDE
ncbi:type IV secretory system conjugative DNA transfer family protein [Sabulibacter ruber]|uniref:type IV secretory system conjugative DNA transfer family protein n=1 Tax=Sabulibacter ruber TaxID=2811901 RepID=UPI001A96ACC1|nr:TraM recognition domain-containing protein [Sabulibacter ruber]